MLIQIHLKQDLLIILCQFVRFSVVDKLMYCAQNGLEFGSRNNELLSVLNPIQYGGGGGGHYGPPTVFP